MMTVASAEEAQILRRHSNMPYRVRDEVENIIYRIEMIEDGNAYTQTMNAKKRENGTIVTSVEWDGWVTTELQKAWASLRIKILEIMDERMQEGY